MDDRTPSSQEKTVADKVLPGKKRGLNTTPTVNPDVDFANRTLP